MEVESRTKMEIYEGKIRGFEGEIEFLKQRNNALRETNQDL